MGSQTRDRFLNTLDQNKGDKKTGIYSICSANKTVLQASFLQAKKDNSILLVESTSNQVDQFGGYTGMKPEDFIAYVSSLARWWIPARRRNPRDPRKPIRPGSGNLVYSSIAGANRQE